MAGDRPRHVDAATVAGLAPLHFVRLRPRAVLDVGAAAGGGTPSSLLHRARWLAFGVGPQAAALAAARALLAERAPHILVASHDHAPPPAATPAAPASSSPTNAPPPPQTLPVSASAREAPAPPAPAPRPPTSAEQKIADAEQIAPGSGDSTADVPGVVGSCREISSQEAGICVVGAEDRDEAEARAKWLKDASRPGLQSQSAPMVGLVHHRLSRPTSTGAPAVHSTPTGDKDAHCASVERAIAPSSHALPDLWLFAANDEDLANTDLSIAGERTKTTCEAPESRSVMQDLCEAFDIVDKGVWDGEHRGPVVAPLLSALMDHVASLIESVVGALRLGSDLLFLPIDRLVYRLALAFNHRGELLLRVAVYRSDCMRLLSHVGNLDGPASTQLLVAPLGIGAVLPRHPRIAGDSLASAVYARWSEGALVPSRSETSGLPNDRTVVFVDFGDDVVLPVPRICLVAVDGVESKDACGKEYCNSKQHCQAGLLCGCSVRGDASTALDGRRIGGPGRSESGADGTFSGWPSSTQWRRRKRPRSPSAEVDALERAAERDATALAAENAEAVRVQAERASVLAGLPVATYSAVGEGSHSTNGTGESAPTPGSITRAIQLAAGRAALPTPPVLYHPLAQVAKDRVLVDDNDLAMNTCSNDLSTDATEKGDPSGSGAQSQIQSADLLQGTAVSAAASRSAAERASNNHLNGNVDELDEFYMHSSDRLSNDDPDTAMGLRNNGSASGGGGLDMDPLCAFDDDVSQFFAVAEATAVPSHALAGIVGGGGVSGETSGSCGHFGQDSDPSMRLPMEVEEKAEKGASCDDGRTIPSSFSGGWLADGLAVQDVSSPTGRPGTPEREAELQSFLKEDLELRFTTSRCVTADPYLTTIRKVPASLRLRCPAEGKGSGLPDAHRRSSLTARDYVPRHRIRSFRTRSSFKSEEESLDSDSDGREADKEGTDRQSEGIVDLHGMNTCNGADGTSHNISSATTGDLVSVDMHADVNDSAEKSLVCAPLSSKLSLASTAVDCASACYILVEKFRQRLQSGRMALEGRMAKAMARVREGARTDENGSIVPLMSPCGTSNLRNSDPGYHPYPPYSSSIRVKSSDGKRESSYSAVYSLLQMQVLGAPELCLIPPQPLRVPCLPSKSDGPGDGAHAVGLFMEMATMAKLEAVPSSLARRVLFGLPRIIEWGMFVDSMATSEGPNARSDPHRVIVSGPLSRGRGERASSSGATRLELPKICVGFDRDWIETRSNILPLWEKSGLEPYADVKNIHYAVLAPKALADDVRPFFRDVSAAYEECSMGRHSPMPFDAVSLIGNSVPNESNEPESGADVVSITEERMIQQYHLSATGLAAKLTAVSKDMRSGDSLGPNFVIYVVSPFQRHRRGAIAALLHAITPLLSCLSTSPSLSSTVPAVPSVLVSMPWRQCSASEQGMSGSCATVPSMLPNGPSQPTGSGPGLTIRLLPYEAIERFPNEMASRPERIDRHLLRPQLVKAVAFAVYCSLRTKRLRRGASDIDNVGLGSSAEHSDELLSPMTPDVVHVGSPSGALAPGSPAQQLGVGEDILVPALPAAPTHDLPLSSFLYDPLVVLAGVGQQIGQHGPEAEVVFHLAYTYIEAKSHFLFAWTDGRGEILDISGLHVTSNTNGHRSSAFSRMWSRGRRWWVPYADHTCVTIAKLGESMLTDEVVEWECIVHQFVARTNARVEDSSDTLKTRLRFPEHRIKNSGCEHSDVIKEVATPATPAPIPSVVPGAMSGPARLHHSPPEHPRDVAAATLRSVSILTIVEYEYPDIFASEADEELLITSDGEGESVAKASLIVEGFGSENKRQIDIDLHSHFGQDEAALPCTWDTSNQMSILKHIASNFNALRTVAAAPCWPLKKWRGPFPLHVEAVWNLRNLLSELFPSASCL